MKILLTVLFLLAFNRFTLSQTLDTGKRGQKVYAANDYLQQEQPTTNRKDSLNPFDREINCSTGTIDRIQITDASGKIVYDQSGINTRHFIIKDVCFYPGMYFVKAFDKRGHILVQKIFTK